jgi:hypothetical protein
LVGSEVPNVIDRDAGQFGGAVAGVETENDRATVTRSEMMDGRQDALFVGGCEGKTGGHISQKKGDWSRVARPVARISVTAWADPIGAIRGWDFQQPDGQRPKASRIPSAVSG